MSNLIKKATITHLSDNFAVARFGPGMNEIMQIRWADFRGITPRTGAKVELRYEIGQSYGFWFAYPDTEAT